MTGHLEDTEEAEPTELTADERERYSRGRELLQLIDTNPRVSGWEAQLELKRASVAVVGLGGIGGVVALSLAVTGVGHVHCVDGDIVELSDLNRQIPYTERDLGQPKVNAVMRCLREHNSSIGVSGERRDVDGPDAAAAIAAGFDLVVLAADTPSEIASWTNRACYEARTPWVLGGYDGPLMYVGLYRPGLGPCYDCALTEERERVAVLPPPIEWAPAAGNVPPHAVNVNIVNATASFVSTGVISLLTGVPPAEANRLYQFNSLNCFDASRPFGPFPLGPVRPHPRCPTCGPQA